MSSSLLQGQVAHHVLILLTSDRWKAESTLSLVRFDLPNCRQLAAAEVGNSWEKNRSSPQLMELRIFARCRFPELKHSFLVPLFPSLPSAVSPLTCFVCDNQRTNLWCLRFRECSEKEVFCVTAGCPTPKAGQLQREREREGERGRGREGRGREKGRKEREREGGREGERQGGGREGGREGRKERERGREGERGIEGLRERGREGRKERKRERRKEGESSIECERGIESSTPAPCSGRRPYTISDKWLPSLFLKTSRDGAPTTSGGKLFHWLILLPVKKFLLSSRLLLSLVSFHPLLLVLHSGALENKLTPPPLLWGSPSNLQILSSVVKRDIAPFHLTSPRGQGINSHPQEARGVRQFDSHWLKVDSAFHPSVPGRQIGTAMFLGHGGKSGEGPTPGGSQPALPGRRHTKEALPVGAHGTLGSCYWQQGLLQIPRSNAMERAGKHCEVASETIGDSLCKYNSLTH
ncbi:Octapeptide-repeat protein T2, partial [Ophiophagus hannah]